MAKPGRRITLTPLPSQPPPLSHFSSSPNSSGNCWKSNPVFTNHSMASESPPASLSEERRLLKEERSRRRQKHGSRTAPPSQRDSGIRKPSPSATCNTTARDKTSMSAQRGQQFKGQSLNRYHGDSSAVTGIDLKISTHSIFELNHGRNSTKRNDTSNSVSDQRSISTLSAATSATTGWLPLTSTPLPSRGCSQVLSHASVTHQDALDLLSGHYATLIAGKYRKSGKFCNFFFYYYWWNLPRLISNIWMLHFIDHMLPNLTSEIHFILQLLTANAPHTPKQTSRDGMVFKYSFWVFSMNLHVCRVCCCCTVGESSSLFESVDNCVYFAVAVLDKIKQ